MDHRSPSADGKPATSLSSTGGAKPKENFEAWAREDLVKRIRDLESRERLLERAVRQLEARCRGSAMPSLTWKRAGDDFVLTDHNAAAQKYLGSAACPGIGTSASEFYGENSSILRNMTACFSSKAGLKVKDRSRCFKLSGRGVVLSTYSFVPSDRVMIHLMEISPPAGSGEGSHDPETRYQTLFEYNPVQTIVVDREARILDYNLAKKRAHDRLPNLGDVLFRDYAAKYPMDMHAELIDCIVNQAFKEFAPLPYRDKHLSVTMAPLPDGALIATLDVSALMRAEQEVRRLSGQLIQSEENERRKISWMLHDELAQELFSLKISVDALCLDTDRTPRDVRESLAGLSESIGRSIQTTRDLCQRLHPTLLDRFGLVPAIQELCDDLEEKNRCRVDLYSVGVRSTEFDLSLAVTVYRLVEEAFRNIRKHAGADRVNVRLSVSSPDLILAIQDNGRGFDPNQGASAPPGEKHLGLSIMQERAALLGGEMTIQSRPKGGTRLRFRIPLGEPVA